MGSGSEGHAGRASALPGETLDGGFHHTKINNQPPCSSGKKEHIMDKEVVPATPPDPKSVRRRSRPSKVINCMFSGLAAVLLAATALISLGVAFFAGYVYSQLSNGIDRPLRSAEYSSAAATAKILKDQSRQIANLLNVSPMQVLSGSTTVSIISDHVVQLKRLQFNAEKLAANADTDSLVKFRALRQEIFSLQPIAGKVTRSLFIGSTLGPMMVLLLMWIGLLIILGPALNQVSVALDKLEEPKTARALARG